jgi:hypothetical protein
MKDSENLKRITDYFDALKIHPNCTNEIKDLIISIRTLEYMTGLDTLSQIVSFLGHIDANVVRLKKQS